MEIKRSTERIFCEYCKEPMAMGKHAVSLEIAQRLPKEKCAACGKKTLVACILGIGHFVYVCETSDKIWTNADL